MSNQLIKKSSYLFYSSLILFFIYTLSACGCNETPDSKPEEIVSIPIETLSVEATSVPSTDPPPPTETPLPPPELYITVDNGKRSPLSIPAGESVKIELEIVSHGEANITYEVGPGTFTEVGNLIYEYTAPNEGGKVTLVFTAELKNYPLIETKREFEFNVLDVAVDDPLTEVPCDSQLTCGFTAKGTVAGSVEGMAVALFVRPEGSNEWLVSKLLEIPENGVWEIDAKVQQDPVFAGTQFIMQAMVLEEDEVAALSSQVTELPTNPAGKSNITNMAVVSSRAPLETSEEYEVTIESPIFGSNVPYNQQTSIQGTASNIPSDSILWAMVYPPNGLYFPQNSVACPGAKGTPIEANEPWTIGRVNFGGEGTMQFDIVVVLTTPDSEVDIFFRDYFRQACGSGDFYGIPPSEIPTDIIEVASVTVRADE